MELAEQIKYLAKAVEEGSFDPLEAALIIKKAENAIKAAKKIIGPATLTRLGGSPTTLLGYKIIPQAGRARYSYKNIDAWNATNKRLKQLEALAKQALTDGVACFDPETGEEVPAADLSYSAESYKIEKE